MTLFGTSGIRGIYPQKINSYFFIEFARAISKDLAKKVVVGFDGRKSGIALIESLKGALNEQGKEVYDLGICPSPTLANYTKKLNTIGLMITASHNPIEYNGIKIFYKGKEAPKELEQKMEKNFLNPKMKLDVKLDWRKAAGQKKIFDAHIEHLKTLKKIFELEKLKTKIKKNSLNILVDCANLAASNTYTKIFEQLGIKIIKNNCELFKIPDRAIEPNEQTLSNLEQKIKELDIDLAIAYDGDGDRAVVLDETGKTLGLDVQLAIAADYIIKKTKTKKIVSTSESSILLKEIVQKNKAKLYLTPVGSRYVYQKIKKINAKFGGEPCGEYIFNGGVGSPDALASSLLFFEIYLNEGALSQIKKDYKNYPISRIKINCENSKKQKVMQILEKKWPYKTKTKLDGLRADEQWGWVLVRPSGTEEYIRITIQTYKQEELENNLKIIKEVVENAISSV
jgi:phosphoglucosamine mutase